MPLNFLDRSSYVGAVIAAVLALFLSGAPARADDQPAAPAKTEAAAAQSEATDVNTGAAKPAVAPAPAAAAPAATPIKRRAANSTADHSKFEALKGPFANGSEVTKACLTCHTEAGKHFMKSIHWTWEYTHPKTGQKLGKSVLVNNYLHQRARQRGHVRPVSRQLQLERRRISISPSRKTSTVLSATTGPAPITRLRRPRATRPAPSCSRICSPSTSSRSRRAWTCQDAANCGSCHFNGGGGDGVKHGDLDSSLNHPAARSRRAHGRDRG